MKNFLYSVAAAATLAFGHAAPAMAQDYDLDGMQQSLTMLELTVSQIFTRNGIDVDPRTLDLSQIAQIVSRFDSGDDQPTRSELEFIINRN
ncbi:hypothetical protein [Palleronia marisminoris]|nr:hypothetical protein [Palleronia marisminoris]